MLRPLRFLIVGFYALLALSAPAVAGTILGNLQQCMYLANSAAMLQQIKKESPGQPWAEVEKEMLMQVREAIGSPTSYIKDADDARVVMQVVYLVWEKDVSPEEILEKCLNS